LQGGDDAPQAGAFPNRTRGAMDRQGPVLLAGAMRSVVLVILILVLGVTSADARRRKHRHYRHQPVYVMPPPDLPRMIAPGRRDRGLPPEQADRVAPSPEAFERQPSRGGAQLVPPDWQLQPADPNWKGKRYLSPDGASWFAAYATAVEQEPLAAHMRAVAFIDGEEITALRGERDWIAVSGLKADRIFYRKAVLACAGKRWHHMAFEYPAAAKRSMDAFVVRAARALDHSENDGCDAAISSSH
jgi:hypothetical protein